VEPLAAGLAAAGIAGSATLASEGARRRIVFGVAGVAADPSDGRPDVDQAVTVAFGAATDPLCGSEGREQAPPPVTWSLTRLGEAADEARENGRRVDRHAWQSLRARADRALVPTSARSRLGAG
jgi:hypothetical protein